MTDEEIYREKEEPILLTLRRRKMILYFTYVKYSVNLLSLDIRKTGSSFSV